jgi:SAM-dependent methyltransferase
MSLKKVIQSAYNNIAAQSGSCVCDRECSDNYAGKLGYSPEERMSIPDEANLGLSCGNPTAIAGLRPGEVVLDLGSGAGFDSFLAASKVTESGKVIGIDFSEEMVRKAKTIALTRRIGNVEFIHAYIEELPLPAASVDIVISNCVLNLIPDKQRVYQGVYRVLRSGGRISIADIALLQPIPSGIYVQSYTNCLDSAILITDYENILKQAGFRKVRITAKPVGGCFSEDSADPFGRSIGKQFNASSIRLEDYIASILIEAVKPSL